MIEACRAQMERWNLIRQQSINWRIFYGILTVGGIYLIVSLVAVGKELVLARQYGTTDEMDAFLVAFLPTSFLVNVLSGSFHVSFIPEYIRVREGDGEEKAKDFFANILCWYISLLFFFSLVLFVASPLILPLFFPYFGPDKLALSQSLFLILIPTLVLSGMIKAWGSVLNAGERFALTSISPVMTHAVTVIVLFSIGKTWGIHALAIGIILGFSGEAGILIWGLKSRGFPFLPKWPRFDGSMQEIIQQYFPVVIGSFLMGATAFVDQGMATMVGPGSISALSYAGRIPLLIVGISAVSLGTVTLPYFSRMVALRDKDGIRHTLWMYTRIILFLTIPVITILIYFSEPLVRSVFERGAFTASNTDLVAQIQALFFLQIPFYILGMLGIRLLSALKKNRIIMLISGVNFFVNIGGNFFFMKYLGVAGIALSTSLVYAISTTLVYVAIIKQLRGNQLLVGSTG